MQKAQRFAPGFLLQRRRDSNPRNLSVQRFSRPPRSTTLPLLYEIESFSRPPLPIAIGTTTLPLLYENESFSRPPLPIAIGTTTLPLLYEIESFSRPPLPIPIAIGMKGRPLCHSSM
jgi:hypothetical protein